MEINLVTHNKNKVTEFRHYLEPDITVNHIDMEYLEMRAPTNEEVAKYAAQELANRLNKPVVVEDSGFYIEAYEGFPGVHTKTVFQQIGCRGLLKLMQGIQDRQVRYKSAIAYCKEGGIPHVFTGEETGVMAEEERGTLGWGQDSIFIPSENNPEQETYGETRLSGENLFRNRAIARLKEFLLSNP